MPKWALKSRLLQLRISTCVSSILCLIAVIQLFGYYGVYNYKHIPRDDIPHELYKQISPNLVLKKSKLECSYDNILKNTKSLHSWDVPRTFNDFSASGIDNGSYVPEHCNPLFSVALLVTYRNRQQQLDVFLPYMHNFLRKQNIHYKIFLIEQQDNKPWNKGLLYNIGARYAMLEKFPCLILHDVDLLPLNEGLRANLPMTMLCGEAVERAQRTILKVSTFRPYLYPANQLYESCNLYACVQHPRHMSASIDKFRFVLPYRYLVGGALAITADQYNTIDGFSNRFEGWGGEDDDLAARIEAAGLHVQRFPRDMSEYTMLVHRQEAKNANRESIMAENRKTGGSGLAGARYSTLRLVRQRLATLVAVTL